MRLQTGIITQKLEETSRFFVEHFGFREKFASEWFILLHAPASEANELAIMLPDQPQVRLAGFQKPYGGSGVWLILESDSVTADYDRLRGAGLPIELPLTEEEWGDTHFVVRDPNGILVDIVQRREVGHQA